MTEKRRRLMQGLGALALPMVAGCLGDDGEGTPTDTEEPTGDSDDDSDGTDTDTPGESIERHDFTMNIYRGTPVPADAQFNPYAGTSFPAFVNGAIARHPLFKKAHHNQQYYGEVVADWQYQPGILEFEMHDDFYFWDGGEIDADAVLDHMALQNYVNGGDELDNYENIVNIQKIDDYTIRASLADAWTEAYALGQTFEGFRVDQSKEWASPWLESFDDAANMDEIGDIREELGGTLDTDPTPFLQTPFKITEAEENHWNARLRTEDSDILAAPEEPHYVDEINYKFCRYWAVEDSSARGEEAFRNQDVYYNVEPSLADEVDFDAEHYPVQPGTTTLSFLFNMAAMPSANPRFRRAMNYLNKRDRWHQEYTTSPRTRTSPFLTDGREENFISQSMLDQFEDYEPNTVNMDAAAAELEAGGFERDSDGQWLFQEGDRAGDPMEWEIWMYGWWNDYQNVGQGFLNDLEELGINCNYRLDNALWMRQRGGEFIMDTAYYGGGSPAFTFGQTFDDNAISGAGHPSPPDQVDAPPVGTPWPEADSLETYNTRSMTQQLPVTTDETRYQRLVDRLSWVANQAVPRAPIFAFTTVYSVNTNAFDMLSIEEAPAKHSTLLYQSQWQNGAVSYVPEDER